MSEYQYYEFAALDGPISDEGLHYAENCSSRADVSRVHWRNVYNYGDFHGSVDRMLQHYDAHFYIVNWGTAQFAVALPQGILDPKAVEPYLRGHRPYESALSISDKDNRTIVWWETTEEGGWGWIEGEGILSQLIGIREELMRGDYRALYLGWLADFRSDEWRKSRDQTLLMPSVPSGLDRLTPALHTLLEYFPVDPDALSVAVEYTRDRKAGRIPISDTLDMLSFSEMKSLLTRVADGDGMRVMSELNRLTYRKDGNEVKKAVTCVAFAEKAIKAREVRIEKEAKAAEAKRKRAAAKRKRHLKEVFERADVIWTDFTPLMEVKKPSTYKIVAKQLKELKEAYDQAGKDDDFQTRLTEFRDLYSRRSAMMSLITEL